MLVEHRGVRPTVHPDAYVAPNAVLCGDVRVAAGARILFGAVLTAEDGHVEVGERAVVMEHALVRGRSSTPAVLGDDVLVGPNAHVNGAVVEAEAFLATGVAIFPGTVYGLPRGVTGRERNERQSAWFGAHRDDAVLPDG